MNLNRDGVLDTSIVVDEEMHHSHPEDSLPGVRSMVNLLASSELASAFKRGFCSSLDSSHPITEKKYAKQFLSNMEIL